MSFAVSRPVVAVTDRFRVTVKCGADVTVLEISPGMTIGQASAAIAKKIGCKSPTHYVLIITWRHPVTGETNAIVPSVTEDLNTLLDGLGPTDSKMLCYHHTERPFHIKRDKEAKDGLQRELQFYRCGVMVMFGDLYKWSNSASGGGLVWRKLFCILLDSALVCYGGWRKGWKRYPLALTDVTPVDVNKNPQLGRLPYRGCLASTVFELEMPKKSLLFHTTDAVSCAKWCDSLRHAITNASDNNSVLMAECVISDICYASASRFDNASAVLYTCDIGTFMKHPICAASLLSYLSTLSTPAFQEVFTVYCDLLLFQSLLRQATTPDSVSAALATSTSPPSAPNKCVSCHQRLLVLTKCLSKAAVKAFHDSSLEVTLTRSRDVSGMAFDRAACEAFLQLLHNRCVDSLGTKMRAFRASVQFQMLLEYLRKSEFLGDVPSKDYIAAFGIGNKPKLRDLASPSSIGGAGSDVPASGPSLSSSSRVDDDPSLWYIACSGPVLTCDTCIGDDEVTVCSDSMFVDGGEETLREGGYADVIPNMPSVYITDIAAELGWIASEFTLM